MNLNDQQQQWFASMNTMAGWVNTVNVANGWFDEERSFGDDVALLHSEVSEAFEAYRNGEWDGDKDSVQDELADIFIRLLDTCMRHDVNLVEQFVKKMVINEKRGYKHGGKLV